MKYDNDQCGVWLDGSGGGGGDLISSAMRLVFVMCNIWWWWLVVVVSVNAICARSVDINTAICNNS